MILSMIHALPCDVQPLTTSSNLRQPNPPDQTVILIAEDEILFRDVVRLTLEAEGYFVLTANDGAEALSVARQFPGTIHALVSDVKMPLMDGLQLREAILIERPDIRVLLMSGLVGAVGDGIPFVRKPIGPSSLKERVRQLLS
jgi:CheY-like chemotaxis protein